VEEAPPILSNVVRFELPLHADVDDFCTRLRLHWPGTKRRKGEVWLISARLRTNADDLAVLLREVEAYVTEAELHAIRFRLDGRAYILATPAPAPAGRPAHVEIFRSTDFIA